MTMLTAAPFTYAHGVKDGSIRAPVYNRIPVPDHLPLVYGFAAKGDSELSLVKGDDAFRKHGDGIFDVRSEYATHQTVLAQILNAAGNAIMFKRLIPEDAGPAANVRISLELVKTQINPKQRNDDGTYKLGSLGEQLNATQTIEGYLAKFIAEYIQPGPDGKSNIGKGSRGVGTLVGNNSEESARIPLLDFEVSSPGKWGNLQGIRIWSPDINSSHPVNENLVRKQKAYPYVFGFVEKATADDTATLIHSDTGEQQVQLTLKPDTFDPATDTDYYAGTELLRLWAMPDMGGTVKPTGTFGKFFIYQNYLDALLVELAKHEKAALTTYPGLVHDLDSTDTEDYHRFNLFGAHTTQGVPYITFQVVKHSTVATERVLRFTERSNIMATGGKDGTMNNSVFNKLVAKEIASFADHNSKYLDVTRFPISIFYDTGFDMPTKQALGKLIAIRKDVLLVASTQSVDEREPTPSEESSIAIALRTTYQAFPESTLFGTPVMRAMVVAHRGRLVSSRYRKRAPLTLDLAYKFARFMGAGDGKWRGELSPDKFPANKVDLFSEISESYKPASVRHRDWRAGLVWVDACDIESYFWPAIRTVYDNDTSILTSAITACCICSLWKVGEQLRIEFSGDTTLTNAQLKERIEARFNELVHGKYDGRYDLLADVQFTKRDIANGYSWLLRIQISGNNMKTAQNLYIEALRRPENEVATTNISI